MTHKVVYRMKLVGDERLVEFLQPFLASYVEGKLTLGRAREFEAAANVLFGDAVSVETVSISKSIVRAL